MRGPRGSWVDCLSHQVTDGLDEWLFSTEPGLQANSFFIIFWLSATFCVIAANQLYNFTSLFKTFLFCML